MLEYFYVDEKMKKKPQTSISLRDLHLTLFIPMDFPIHVDRISMELPIWYFKGSHMMHFVPEDWQALCMGESFQDYS